MKDFTQIKNEEDIARYLFECARLGTLFKVPPSYLTREILCYQLSPGPIDPEPPDPTDDNYLESDEDPQVEQRFTWETVIAVAASNGNLHQIPKTILAQCANEIIPPETGCDYRPDTILHMAAKRGQLNQFPKRCLTVEAVFERFNTANSNVAMLAALNGNLEHLPAGLLRESTVTRRYPRGETLCHYIAAGGQIPKLPDDLIKAENFVLKDDRGSTPLHWVWSQKDGKLDGIPSDFYNETVVTMRNDEGNSILDFALNMYAHGRNLRRFHFPFITYGECALKDGGRFCETDLYKYFLSL